MLRTALIVPVAAIMTLAATPSAQQPSPDTIYSLSVKAMNQVAAAGAPPFLTYKLDYAGHDLHLSPSENSKGVDWNFKVAHGDETQSFQVWYRAKDRRALTQSADTHAAYVGEPLFELMNLGALDTRSTPAPQATAQSQDSGAQAKEDAGKVLDAITVNGSRYYRVALVGIEDFESHPVYHLHLTAYREPLDHPLTDLFIDTSTYRVWKARAEFTIRAVAFGGGGSAEIEFSPVSGYWLMTGLQFDGKGYALLWHVNAGVSFLAHDVVVPPALPDLYFTPRK